MYSSAGVVLMHAVYWEKHGDKLPDTQLIGATFRKKELLVMEEDEESWELCLWFIFELMPLVSEGWREQVEAYHNINTFNELVTVTDEAFAYRVLEMYGRKWEDAWLKIRCEGEEVETTKNKYRRYKDNNQEGDDDTYEEWFEMVKKDRDGAYNQVWQGYIEQVILARKSKHTGAASSVVECRSSCTAGTKKRRRALIG